GASPAARGGNEQLAAREVPMTQGHVVEGSVLTHLGGGQDLVVAAARRPRTFVGDPAEADLAQLVAPEGARVGRIEGEAGVPQAGAPVHRARGGPRGVGGGADGGG